MSNKKIEKDILYMLDYYQRPFYLLHQENRQSYKDFFSPHPIRFRFWQLVPHGYYEQDRARELLNSYLLSIESELSKHIEQSSIAYCLHLYRRLSPGPVGTDKQPLTIGLTRAVLEAVFQKYASFSLCEKIAESASIPINEVLGGLLMNEEFEPERNIVAQGNQLVLTKFTSIDLQHFYDLERLAYEIWRTAAALRTTGKGAPLIVCEPPLSFADDRSDDLDFLVTNYDQRLDQSSLSHSAAGVEFSTMDAIKSAGVVFLPLYNLKEVTSEDYKEILSLMYKVRLQSEVKYNFVWFPFNLRDYRNAHRPFAVPFTEKYGISLDAVLAVVAALLLRVLYIWTESGIAAFTRFHQRAYEGPITYETLLNEIDIFIPHACALLEVEESCISKTEVLNAIKFWELNMTKRRDIDLSYSGPHYLFLPIQSGQYFIDYAWIFRRLYDLFVGVWISNQNFKGDALENAVQQGPSVLPSGPCKALNGEQRQIDYAINLCNNLVILECKAVGRSIGFDRGDPRSIKHRTDNVVELSLSQADEKASWLVSNPVGTNYDVSTYSHILPIGVSPFVEYIHSKDKYYWISDNIPRVLTVKEFKKITTDKNIIDNAHNKITVNRSK